MKSKQELEELRERGVPALQAELKEARNRLFQDRVRFATRNLDNSNPLRVGRKRVAHRRLRGVDRAARLVGTALRDASDELAGKRRAHLDPLARLDPLAVDKEHPLRRCRGHAASVREGQS